MCQFSHTTLTSAKEQGAWIQIDDEMSCSDKDKVKAPHKAKTDKSDNSDNSNKEHAASAAATPDTSGGTQQKEKLTPPLQPQRLPLTDGPPFPAETGQKSDAAEPLSPGTENFFLQGLEDALDAEVEKTSPPSKKVRREEPTRDLRQWMTKSTQPAEAAPNQPQPSPSQKGSGPEPAAHVKTEPGSGCHSLQVKVKTEPTSPKQQPPAHSLPSQPQQAQQAEPAETQIQTPTQQHTLEANAGTYSTCEQPTKHEHAGPGHISKDTMDMETAAGEDTETVTAAPTITLAVAAAARHDESLAETQATHPSTPQDTSVMMPDSGNAKASDEPGDQTETNGANIAVAAAATNLSQQLQQPQQTANTQIDMTSETMAKEETIDRVNLVSEKSEKQRNTAQDQEAFAKASTESAEVAEAEAAAAATAIATQQLPMPMPAPPVPTPVSVPAPVCEEVDPNRSTTPIHPVNSQTSGTVETSAEAVAEASASAATSPSAHSHAQGESEPKAEAEVAEPVAEMTATATGRTNTTSQPATPPPTKPPSTPAHLQIPIPAPTTPAPSVASSNQNRKLMKKWIACLKTGIPTPSAQLLAETWFTASSPSTDTVTAQGPHHSL